jgi:ABC-type Na+ efflux pump permease subunit
MGRPDLVQMDLETLPPMLAAVSAATVGAVLAMRRPRHPVGWLLQGIALSLGLTAVVAQYLVGALLARPGTLPGTRYALVYYPASVMAGLCMGGFVMLLRRRGRCRQGAAGAGGRGWWAPSRCCCSGS